MRRPFIFVAAIALLIAACGGDADDTGTTTTAAVTAAITTDTEAPADTTTATTPTATGDSVDTSPLAAALAATSEVSSARMEGRITMTGVEDLPAGTEVSMSFAGAFDNATGSSSFTMDLSDLAGAAPAGEEIPAEFADLFGEMEIRTIGDTAYMKFGLFSMFGITTDWVSMSAEDAGDAASSFGANTSDPTELLAAFAAADAEIEQLGSEEVRGVNTTHFRLNADVAAMMEAADPDALDELDDLSGFPQDGTFPVDFWVGDDGHIYRFSFTMDGAADPTSGFGSMAMVWEIFDYGADVDISVPPADQITDGSNLSGFITG